MAESEPKSTSDPAAYEAKKLKYLDFVQVAAVYAVVWCSTLYEYAKDNSGPLRPGVQAVEGTVKTVIGPVYDKFHGVPFDLLKFVDRKVDESITELDCHIPSLFKKAALQIRVAAEKAPEVAGELVSDVQHLGLVHTVSNLAKTTYIKYEPVAEQYAVVTWRVLNRVPLFPQVANIMIPTAAYWAEKYNHLVAYTADRGYAVSYYLPLVPIDRIAKTFEGTTEEVVPPSSVDSGYVAISQ